MRLQTLFLLLFLTVVGSISSLGQPIVRNFFTTNINPQLNITNGNLISTNIYVSNLFATNLTVNYITNINEFRGKTTITTNLYVTNGFITYLTNNTFYTTNVTEQFVTNNLSYITNLYGPFITNNTLYSTNIYTTNLFATYVTNNTDYITNLYGPFITNDTIYTTNIFNSTAYVTNLYGPFITNFQLYSTDIFVTNLTANYITNLQDITTNLYVSNAFFTNLTVEFITNDYSFITNLYTSNAFITNLTANYITNNTLITTNLYVSNEFVTNITIFEAQWDTNKWIGPTNDIDFSFGTYQKFKASTDMEITGLKGVNPTNENTTVLVLDPGGSTRTLYFPNNWTNYTLDKANSYTIGSTNIAIVTLSQYGQENTNVLVRIWGVIPTLTTSQVWSNYQGFIFPAGEPAPDAAFTLPGPSVFFRGDGSLFQGTNVMKGLAPMASVVYQPGAVSMVTSNEPNHFIALWDVQDDSDDLLFESSAQINALGNKDDGNASFKLSSSITNGAFDDLLLYVGPSGNPINTQLLFRTNGTAIFTVDKHGIVKANGFKNGALTATNFFSGYVLTSTNQNQVTPDFSVPEQLMSTNAAFTFLAPVGVDATKTTVQWTLVNVTNTTAAAVLITSPANCHTVGTPYVTNLTAVWFQCYAQKFTNAFYIPVF